MNRRTFLKLASAGVSATTPAPISLAFAAAPAPRPLFGAAVNPRLLREGHAAYRDAIQRHCRIVVPEGGLKWEGLRLSPTTFDFGHGDRFVQYATENSMAARGHALVWHLAMPKWTKAIETPRAAEDALRFHISTVVARYAGRIASWDVVNEPLPETPGTSAELRSSIWQALLGERYIDLALEMAAAADPAAELVINEYDLEFAGERFQRKRNGILHLLHRLLTRGAILHAVGLQAHLRGERDIDRAGLRNLIRTIRGMGLDVLITELDVMDHALPSDPAARDTIVAQRVAELLETVFEECTPKSILTWGLTDRHAWIPEHFKRRDGARNRPLPLDDNYTPKPFLKVLQRFGAPLLPTDDRL